MLFTAYVLLRTELFKAYFCISLYLLFKLKCLLYAYECIIAYCYGCHFMANTVYILYHQVADEWLIPVSITMTTVSNSTPTETSGTSAAEGPRLYFIPLVIVPLWILVGNSLVLLAVVRQRSLRTLSNSVIASLAFADFLLAVLVVPLGVYQLVSWQISSIEIHEFSSSDSIVSRDVCRVSNDDIQKIFLNGVFCHMRVLLWTLNTLCGQVLRGLEYSFCTWCAFMLSLFCCTVFSRVYMLCFVWRNRHISQTTIVIILHSVKTRFCSNFPVCLALSIDSSN